MTTTVNTTIFTLMSNTLDDPVVTLEEVDKLITWIKTLPIGADRVVAHAYLMGARGVLVGSTRQQIYDDTVHLMD